ncbi:MAG: DJ-1/PfpI family protein [Bacteroidota bacterium]
MKKITLFTLLFSMLIACENRQNKSKTTHQENTKAIEKSKVLSTEEINEILKSEAKIKIDSVGILLYDKFFELDAVGPYQVLSGMMGTKVFYVAPKKGIITGSSGMQINVEHTIDEIEQLDILLIPGGTVGTVAAAENEEIINWIKKIDEQSIFTTSVCTGAWILGEAGLLKNKKATTNWYRAKEKLAKYNVLFIDERWVNDGKYWTSAGVSAGIDMSLALVAEIRGETYAKLLMLNLEYDPEPPFEGGSVSNTNVGLVNYLTAMYDGVLEKN